MSIITEQELIKDSLLEIAKKMVIAARTAPKGRGIDHMEFKIIEGETIEKISAKMKSIGKETDFPAFIRDADNILQAPYMVLFATKVKSLGLKKCGLCGFDNCAVKNNYPLVPCAFNSGDLGIAIGSAVSIATDNRVDNRIMYTVGIAVKELGLFEEGTSIVYAIPLSATSKNPFFDRK